MSVDGSLPMLDGRPMASRSYTHPQGKFALAVGVEAVIFLVLCVGVEGTFDVFGSQEASTSRNVAEESRLEASTRRGSSLLLSCLMCGNTAAGCGMAR